MAIPLTKEVIGYIGRYGGMCRDCADENGVCPTSGLPCAGREKAIRHVISAYNYGIENGFIHSSQPPATEQKSWTMLDSQRKVKPIAERLRQACQEGREILGHWHMDPFLYDTDEVGRLLAEAIGWKKTALAMRDAAIYWAGQSGETPFYEDIERMYFDAAMFGKFTDTYQQQPPVPK